MDFRSSVFIWSIPAAIPLYYSLFHLFYTQWISSYVQCANSWSYQCVFFSIIHIEKCLKNNYLSSVLGLHLLIHINYLSFYFVLVNLKTVIHLLILWFFLIVKCISLPMKRHDLLHLLVSSCIMIAGACFASIQWHFF